MEYQILTARYLLQTFIQFENFLICRDTCSRLDGDLTWKKNIETAGEMKQKTIKAVHVQQNLVGSYKENESRGKLLSSTGHFR